MQTAYSHLPFVGFLIRSIQIPFPAQLPFAYAMRFVPMQFRNPNPPISNANARLSLQLSPATLSIHFTQTSEFPDRRMRRNPFHITNFFKYFKIHRSHRVTAQLYHDFYAGSKRRLCSAQLPPSVMDCMVKSQCFPRCK